MACAESVTHLIYRDKHCHLAVAVILWTRPAQLLNSRYTCLVHFLMSMDSIFLTPPWHTFFLTLSATQVFGPVTFPFGMFFFSGTNQVYVVPAITPSMVNFVVMQLSTAGLSWHVLGLCDIVLTWFMAAWKCLSLCIVFDRQIVWLYWMRCYLILFLLWRVIAPSIHLNKLLKWQ
jgi:hypothetical protein